MIKTDVEGYYMLRQGVIVQHNPQAKQAYERQKADLLEKNELKRQLNSMNDELTALKSLVNKLITKDQNDNY